MNGIVGTGSVMKEVLREDEVGSGANANRVDPRGSRSGHSR